MPFNNNGDFNDQLLAEIRANGELQLKLEKLLKYKQEEKKLTDSDEKNLDKYLSLISGQGLRYAFSHLHILTTEEYHVSFFQEHAQEMDYSIEKILYYSKWSGGNEEFVGPIRKFPQAYLTKFLVNTDEGSAGSAGSVNYIFGLMDFIDLIKKTPCITGNNSLAIEFEDNFYHIVHEWLTRKRNF